MAYPGPTGADLSQVPAQYRQAVIDAANRYNVPIALINQGLMESAWGQHPRSERRKRGAEVMSGSSGMYVAGGHGRSL
jgi:hypothetical protein